jgi:hypothetical protein
MVPIMLNKTQLENEGFYNDMYWEAHGKKDAQGRLMKDRNGKYIQDVISDEKHEAGRDDHSAYHAKKNETMKKNYNKKHASSTGNGWVPPEMRANYNKESSSKKKEEGDERRADDKK